MDYDCLRIVLRFQAIADLSLADSHGENAMLDTTYVVDAVEASSTR